MIYYGDTLKEEIDDDEILELHRDNFTIELHKLGDQTFDNIDFDFEQDESGKYKLILRIDFSTHKLNYVCQNKTDDTQKRFTLKSNEDKNFKKINIYEIEHEWYFNQSSGIFTYNGSKEYDSDKEEEFTIIDNCIFFKFKVVTENSPKVKNMLLLKEGDFYFQTVFVQYRQG